MYKDGVSLAKPQYISIYDMDNSMLVSQSGSYQVTFKQPATQSLSFTSKGAYDGWLAAANSTSKQASSINANATTFFVGDDKANAQYRSILSFDTSALPDQAVITGITLKIKKQGQVGANPFAALGNLQVDVRKGNFSNSAALQPVDFQAAASANGVGSIQDAPDAANWYSASLNASAFSFVNLSGATQLRLHFDRNSDNDKLADYLKFFSGNAPAAQQPVLTIQYLVP